MNTQQRHLRAVDKQILMEFYKAQWKTIYDLNNLDWRVALIFIPLVGAVSFVFGIALELGLNEISDYTQGIKAISIIIYLICLYGLWTVAKGQAFMKLKFKTLSDVEKDLDLHGYVYERPEYWRGKWSVIICRRVVLYIVYSILGWFSLNMFAGERVALVLGFIIPIIFVVMHWIDYKLHRALCRCCGKENKCYARYCVGCGKKL